MHTGIHRMFVLLCILPACARVCVCVHGGDSAQSCVASTTTTVIYRVPPRVRARARAVSVGLSLLERARRCRRCRRCRCCHRHRRRRHAMNRFLLNECIPLYTYKCLYINGFARLHIHFVLLISPYIMPRGVCRSYVAACAAFTVRPWR